ncbi:hypothetical protein [Cellvibrio sp. QJXJ]|uniref:hypothetical protein n=1 Tax=Cellvibrio sp. QJXJ TaxID=2964606 RepID=UPI0021C46AD7|nr:hypothetical protein [Cellvibrio sp. QJXJ]UUA75119.1 hypothetical protein NNX04_21935 [Cellvibrio sp. QJXJ]
MSNNFKGSEKKGKARTWAGKSIKWITPLGLITSVIHKEQYDNERILASDNRKLITTRLWIGIVTSIFVLLTSGYLLVNNTPDSNESKVTTTPFSILLLFVAVFCIFRVYSKVQLINKINKNTTAVNIDNSESDNEESVLNKFSIDSTAASLLLFRITVFKYAYFCAGIFSLSLLLSPRNISDIKTAIISGAFRPFGANITLMTAIALCVIFFIKYVTAQKDLNLIKKFNASPTIHGFTTINNCVYGIVNIIVLILLVALLGDKLIVLLATQFPLFIAGIAPIFSILILLIFSVNAFRSAINLAGLQTDDNAISLMYFNILICKPIKLPVPNESAEVENIPNIYFFVSVSFVAAMCIANYTGAVSILVLVPSVFYIGILLAINEFHSELKEIYSE